MSNRSCYNEDPDQNWDWICWRGAVESAIRGKRGQAFLKEMLDTLETMPEKRLIKEELATPKGEVCAIGSVMVKRGLDTSIPVDDADAIASVCGISQALVREIEWINDTCLDYSQEFDNVLAEMSGKAPEERWRRVRDWVKSRIKD